jgi:hypothetical protein
MIQSAGDWGLAARQKGSRFVNFQHESATLAYAPRMFPSWRSIQKRSFSRLRAYASSLQHRVRPRFVSPKPRSVPAPVIRIVDAGPFPRFHTIVEWDCHQSTGPQSLFFGFSDHRGLLRREEGLKVSISKCRNWGRPRRRVVILSPRSFAVSANHESSPKWQWNERHRRIPLSMRHVRTFSSSKFTTSDG